MFQILILLAQVGQDNPLMGLPNPEGGDGFWSGVLKWCLPIVLGAILSGVGWYFTSREKRLADLQKLEAERLNKETQLRVKQVEEQAEQQNLIFDTLHEQLTASQKQLSDSTDECRALRIELKESRTELREAQQTIAKKDNEIATLRTGQDSLRCRVVELEARE